MRKLLLTIHFFSLFLLAGCWKSKEKEEEPASAQSLNETTSSDDSLIRTEESPDHTKNMDIYGPGIGPDRTGPKP